MNNFNDIIDSSFINLQKDLDIKKFKLKNQKKIISTLGTITIQNTMARVIENLSEDQVKEISSMDVKDTKKLFKKINTMVPNLNKFLREEANKAKDNFIKSTKQN